MGDFLAVFLRVVGRAVAPTTPATAARQPLRASRNHRPALPHSADSRDPRELREQRMDHRQASPIDRAPAARVSRERCHGPHADPLCASGAARRSLSGTSSTIEYTVCPANKFFARPASHPERSMPGRPETRDPLRAARRAGSKKDRPPCRPTYADRLPSDGFGGDALRDHRPGRIPVPGITPRQAARTYTLISLSSRSWNVKR